MDTHLEPGRRQNLAYVRDMLKQLKVVSGARRGTALALLMDMAVLEAEKEITEERTASKK